MPRKPYDIKLKHCKHCGKLMQRKIYSDRLERPKQYASREYCNRQCASEATIGRFYKEVPEIYCLNCNKKLEKKRGGGGNWERTSSFSNRKFCNHKCDGIYKSGIRVKNDKTSRKHAHRLIKDSCELCNGVKRLEVHHKDKNPLNNSLDNLITLCKPCHTKAHGRHYDKNLNKVKCEVCDKEAKSLGLCSTHYVRYKKHGNPLIKYKKINGKYELTLENV